MLNNRPQYHQVPGNELQAGPELAHGSLTSGSPVQYLKGASRRIFRHWKALSLVAVVLVTLSVLLRPRTGLENMPAFGTLPCDASKAPHVWHNGTVTRHISLGEDGAHEFAVYGARTFGTVVVTAAPPGQMDVSYTLVVRATQPTALTWTTWRVEGTSAILAINGDGDKHSCVRYDVMLRVPHGARLDIELDMPAHVHLAGGRGLRSVDVSLYGLDPKNLLVVHEDVQADNMTLRASAGYIVGSVSVAQHTLIDSEDGTATVNLDVLPDASDAYRNIPARFTTMSHAGRTDVRYHASAPHRPISSHHQVSDKGDLRLNYTDASFNGVLDVDAGTSSLHNVRLDNLTKYAGDRYGEDRIDVNTQGWAGLYL